MYDPHNYALADGEKLYEMGKELYRMTRDNDLAIPVIKAASYRRCFEASRFLARYWLAKTDYPEPHIWKNKINYRKAAEFALACRDEELLGECFTKFQPGELDDIKARMSAHCKNYDPIRHVCVVSDAECGPVERDWCEWGSYTVA